MGTRSEAISSVRASWRVATLTPSTLFGSGVERKSSQVQCGSGLVLVKSRLGRVESMRWQGCSKRGRSWQAPGVSRVSFLAFPEWLGRAQLSVR